MTVVATERVRGRGRRRCSGRRAPDGTGEDPEIDRQLDDGSLTSVGEVALGEGRVRIVGGALPTPDGGATTIASACATTG